MILAAAAWVALAFAAPGLMGSTNAQPGPAGLVSDADERYEGRPIRAILLREPTTAEDPAEGDPLPEESAQIVRNNIRSYEGAAYRAATVREDVARLNRLNRFRRVEAYARLLEDGSVNLVFALEVQPIIQDVQVTGNRRLTDQQIAGLVPPLAGLPVDRFQIDRTARAIERLYRDRGFYRVQVSVDEDELERSRVVLFRIREYERVKVTDIRFEGGAAVEGRRLRREIETKTARLFRRGALDEAQLDRDVATIVEAFRDEGYLDARADHRVQVSPNLKEAVVIFNVEQGPRYTLRSLRIEQPEGSAITDDQLRGYVELKPGAVYSDEAAREATDAIVDAYGRLGHADAVADRDELRDTDRPLVDLVITVTPGPSYRVGEIVIAGNDLTKQKVIRREVELRPTRPLDTSKLRRTEERLERLRLFNPVGRERGVKITLQRPEQDQPEFRDVLIEVEETNTGSFDIGGAVSSDSGFVGRIALTQRNFDVADTPDSLGELLTGRAFRGAGQTFEMEALPGNEVQTYSISLAEPHLLDTSYSASARAFYRDREFDEFDEERFGGRFNIGRSFGTQWSGSLQFRVESVELSDIDPDRPVDVFEVADQNVIIGVGPRFARTTLDDRFFPTRGARTELSVEQVVGDFQFTRFNAEHAVYLPIRRDARDRATVLSFETRVGYIPQGRDDVPTYERFYLGGRTLRGLAFRTVSPKGISNATGLPTDDPVGGTWLFFAGLEVRQPLVADLLYVVGFLDTGTVTFDPGFEDYRVTAGAGLRIRLPALSPAPLAFDFGFPIVDEEDDETRAFTFSIDLPF